MVDPGVPEGYLNLGLPGLCKELERLDGRNSVAGIMGELFV
jgi:hypothetical protein